MPKLLDLFCCEGGASKGYSRAGFEVTGVDIAPRRRYPFAFVQADAIEYVKEHGHEYDAVAASPPCQAHTLAQRIQGNEHPDLIEPTREALKASGKPYVIENVPGAPLIEPELLCGNSFGLRTYRHRLFETGNGFSFEAPQHREHKNKNAKMGRRVQTGEFMQVVGNFTGVDLAREIMNMPWASREGLREAIPPAYTEYIGKALFSYLQGC